MVFYGSDIIINDKPDKRNTKRSIIISIIAILLYLGVIFLFPSSLATDNSNDDSSNDKNITEYISYFDDFDDWVLDYQLYDHQGKKMELNINNTWSVSKRTGGYSGSYSVSFQFNNFTGYGAVWLERELPIKRYTQYSLQIEYYAKLGENSLMPNNIKPIMYMIDHEPDSRSDFNKLDQSFTQNWEPFHQEYEVKTDDTDSYWFAFGLLVESPSAQGLNFTCYIDNLKISIEETELGVEDFVLIYLKASIMFVIGGVLIFLAIRKQYEPLLLLPIGTGIILSNIPFVGMMEPGGILYMIYQGGIKTGIFPLLIFLGIGAMTDFGPMLANPKTSLLGAAAQFGIFTTLIGALLLGFTLSESSSIGIIGGADGPTAIYLSIHLAPHLLGPIAIAAYSYMALVPIIQPPIIHAMTTEEERKVKMEQMRLVSMRERVLFPIGVIIICAFIIPAATPLVGMLMFGNLMRESGVVQRLADAASNELINIVTIFLGIAVGATMIADTFLTYQTIAIILLGLGAFIIGTATGVFFGKLMHRFSGGQINPMIGAAGVSAVPMAARVVQKEGIKADPNNHLLMHAMGPNVAGVIGSAVAAGVLLTIVGV